MTEIKNVRSSSRPDQIKVNENLVITASNIHEYTEVVDEYTMSGFEYDCVIYSKDEYIAFMAQNAKRIAILEDELEAAKILLGVE